MPNKQLDIYIRDPNINSHPVSSDSSPIQPNDDWRLWYKDNLLKQMDRSNQVRNTLHSRLSQLSIDKLEEILREPMTEDNMVTQAKVAMELIKHDLIAPPTMNHSTIATTNGPAAHQVKQIELSHADLLDATKSALRCYDQVLEWKEEQQEDAAE